MFKLISVFFHPFSFLLLGTALLFNTNTFINFSYSNQLKNIVYIIVFVNSMLLPVLITWYFSKRGLIEDIQVNKLSDRKLVYMVNFLFYIVCLFLLSSLSVPSAVYKYAFGATMTIGGLFVLTFLNQKASAHLAALGGIVGALIMISMKLHTDFFNIIAALIILSGIVGMARIMVKAHKEYEVYLGFLLGFSAQMLVLS